MSDQLPAVDHAGASRPPHLTTPYIRWCRRSSPTLGDQASWRYVEFFAANIRNRHTRRAYARACSRFFAWCEDRGLTLTTIRPFDVGEWVEQLQENHGAPGVKQQLAAVRMMFDWLITGQIVPMNPAAAVRGPKHRRENRQDAGARRQRMAQAHRQHSDRDCARSARPRADRHPHLLFRPHHRSAAHEGRGSSARRAPAGRFCCTRKAASST